MVRATLKGAVRLTAPRAAGHLAARRGRRPGRPDALRGAGRTPLHPQGRARVEPAEGRPQGQDQARQLQRLDRRCTATTTTSSPPSTPTTCRCPTSWSGCWATSATRTSPSSSARRSTGTTTPPSPRPPSRQQFLFHALIQRAGNRYGAPMFVGTNNVVRIARRTADRRALRLHHRGHGHRLRAPPPPQPRHRPLLALRLHPRRAGRRRGARLLDGLLHPAAALVARDVRDAVQAVLARRCSRCRPAGSSATR